MYGAAQVEEHGARQRHDAHEVDEVFAPAAEAERAHEHGCLEEEKNLSSVECDRTRKNIL